MALSLAVFLDVRVHAFLHEKTTFKDHIFLIGLQELFEYDDIRLIIAHFHRNPFNNGQFIIFQALKSKNMHELRPVDCISAYFKSVPNEEEDIFLRNSKGI